MHLSVSLTSFVSLSSDGHVRTNAEKKNRVKPAWWVITGARSWILNQALQLYYVYVT